MPYAIYLFDICGEESLGFVGRDVHKQTKNCKVKFFFTYIHKEVNRDRYLI